MTQYTKCHFCDEPIYQLCKIEVIGFPKETSVIPLCEKHFNGAAKVLPYQQAEELK